MTQHAKEKIQTFARAHWQTLTMAVMALILMGQLFSWGNTFIEFKKVDTLIAQTENVTSNPSPGQSNQNGEKGNSPENSNANSEIRPVRNIFQHEKNPFELSAIFKDQAVIDGNTVKVGERVGKAEVKEIGSNFVMILEEGSDTPRRLDMFQGGGGGDSGGRGSGGPSINRNSSRGTIRLTGSVPNTASGNTQAKIRQRMEEIRNLPPEEQERIRQEFRAIGEKAGDSEQ